MAAGRSILAALLLFCLGFSLSAQTLEEQRRKRSSLEKDIAILRSQISATSTQSEQALASLSLIQAQQQSRRKLIAESDREIASYSRKIVEAQRSINRQQDVLDTLQAHYNRLVLGAYKNRDVKLWYMYILSSENVSQAFRRFGYFKGLSGQIHEQAEKIESVKRSLNEQKGKMMNMRSQAKAMKRQREEELAALQADEAKAKALIVKLKNNSKAYQKSLQIKQTEMRAIDKQIAQMLKDATSQKSGGKKKQVDYILADSFLKNRGKLPWPVEGPVTEKFGPYQNKELKLSLVNNGINIACEPGSQVKAVFDGVVSNVMLAPGYGQCVLIQHGDYYTSYCKLKTAKVRQGDKVTTGQVIGEVATIMGRTQLYFLVWRKQYLNPEVWLRER